MFNPEKKEVPDLELCKKLKELGYPQKQRYVWWWVRWREKWTVLPDDAPLEIWDEVTEVIKAPSVVEMFDLLPLSITDENGMPYYLIISKGEDFWFIGYHLIGEDDYYLIKGKDKTLPNAAAKVLIELLEKNFSLKGDGE